MSEEWQVERKQSIRYQVTVSPDDHMVVRRNGAGCKISSVFIRFERGGPDEDWRGPRVSLMAKDHDVPVLNVPQHIRSVPAWLEDIVARAEPSSRATSHCGRRRSGPPSRWRASPMTWASWPSCSGARNGTRWVPAARLTGSPRATGIG